METNNLTNFKFQLQDARGVAITANTIVRVANSAGTALTILADPESTSKTNPITDVSDNGMVDFWHASKSVQIEVIHDNGTIVEDDVTASTARIVFDPNIHKSQLAYSQVAAGTEVENTTDETALSTVTLQGASLKAGDVIHVVAEGIVLDSNSTDTLAVKLYLGTEVLATIAATDAADADTYKFEAFIVVRTAGASGVIQAAGAMSDLEAVASAAMTQFRVDAASEDLSGTVVVKTTATWSVAHADNEVYSDILIVEVLKASN